MTFDEALKHVGEMERLPRAAPDEPMIVVRESYSVYRCGDGRFGSMPKFVESFDTRDAAQSFADVCSAKGGKHFVEARTVEHPARWYPDAADFAKRAARVRALGGIAA